MFGSLEWQTSISDQYLGARALQQCYRVPCLAEFKQFVNWGKKEESPRNRAGTSGTEAVLPGNKENLGPTVLACPCIGVTI